MSGIFVLTLLWRTANLGSLADLNVLTTAFWLLSFFFTAEVRLNSGSCELEKMAATGTCLEWVGIAYFLAELWVLKTISNSSSRRIY